MKSPGSLGSLKVIRKHIKSASQIKPLILGKPNTSCKSHFNFGNLASVKRKTNYIINSCNSLFDVPYNSAHRFLSKSVVSPVNTISSSEASGVIHAYSGATTNGLFR